MDSIVRGALAPPLIEQTIGEALDATVARVPDGLALIAVHQNLRWTWRELGARTDALAAGFVALGFKPGDRVGIWAPNCAEWALMQFATAKAGIILVNINPAYRLSEVEFTLNKVGVKALVAAERFKTSDYAGMMEELAPEIAACAPGRLVSARLPALKMVVKIGGNARAGVGGETRAARRNPDSGRRFRCPLGCRRRGHSGGRRSECRWFLHLHHRGG